MSEQESKRGLKSRREGMHSLSKNGQSWFLGIGINHYLEFSNLNNAVKDIKDILALLLQKYDIKQATTRLLLDEDATREGIINAFDQLAKEVNPEDKLIIYYSGHGHLDQTTELGYWIPHNAKKGGTANYILNSTIRDYIKVIPSLHSVLISDSCFSGSLLQRGSTRADRAIMELEKRKSRWALCSGRHDEEVFDGPPGQNSPFTKSILKALQFNQKALAVAQLAQEVIEVTASNYSQLPEGSPMFGVGHDGGQYIFRLKEDAKKLQQDPLKEEVPTLTKGTEAKPKEAVIPLVDAPNAPPLLFLMYDQEDQQQVNRIKKFFSPILRQKAIRLFDMHQDVPYGQDQEISAQHYLAVAKIILCFLSSDFIFSQYDLAEKAKASEKRILPILLKTVDLSDTFFHNLKALPANNKPVNNWPDPDSAYTDIVKGVKVVIEQLKK